MSDNAKTRTLDQIRNEYTNLCVKAGNLQYQIQALKQDLELLNLTLRDLNIEASKLPAPEEAKPEAIVPDAVLPPEAPKAE